MDGKELGKKEEEEKGREVDLLNLGYMSSGILKREHRVWNPLNETQYVIVSCPPHEFIPF